MEDHPAQSNWKEQPNWKELTAEIGAITGAWANLEHNLALLLAVILNVEIPFGMSILASVSGFKVRRDLILNAARLAFYPTRIKEVERIVRRVARAASKRNSLAHGVLTSHPEHPDRLLVMEVSPELRPALMYYQLYRLADLKAVTAQIDAVSHDAFGLATKLRKARRQTLHGTPRRRVRRRKV
jgi:hypothetical protein